MNRLKSFSFVLIGFFVVITVISLLMPSSTTTAESVMINAPKDKIVNAISDLKEWKKWHPVFMENNAISFPSSSIAEWESGGKQNKLEVVNKDSAFIQINLSRPGEETIANYFSIQPISSQPGLQVEWRTVTPLRWYPWEKFGGMMMSKVSSSAYQEMLGKLRAFAEN